MSADQEPGAPVLPVQQAALPPSHFPGDAMLLLGEIAGVVKTIPDRLNALERKVDQNNRDVFARINQVDDALDKRVVTCENKVAGMNSAHMWWSGASAAGGVFVGFIASHIKGMFGF